MKFSAITFVLLVIVGITTACTAANPALSPLATASPQGLTAVASPSLQSSANPQNPPAASTPPVDEMEPVRFATIAEAENLAGFDVQEPAYLPEGVSLDFAMLQKAPNPQVTLQYKIIHPQYGDMGAFFHILQEPQPEAPTDVTACGGSPDGACEVLQIGALLMVYHHYAGGTEALEWYANGVVFRLLRTAGEPGKVYRDELVKVVGSMK